MLGIVFLGVVYSLKVDDNGNNRQNLKLKEGTNHG